MLFVRAVGRLWRRGFLPRLTRLFWQPSRSWTALSFSVTKIQLRVHGQGAKGEGMVFCVEFQEFEKLLAPSSSRCRRCSGAAEQRCKLPILAFDVAISSNVMFLICCSLLPCRRSCWGTRTRTSCSACSAWFLFRIAARSLRARKKTRDSHVFLLHALVSSCCCPHVVVHMLAGRSVHQYPASQPASTCTQPAARVLFQVRRLQAFSSVQFSCRLSLIGYCILVIGYQLSVRMLLSACHSIWTPCF